MLKKGDVIELKEGMEVYAMVPKHFFYADQRGCFELERHVVKLCEEFDYLIGTYIVIKTCMDGGGTGMGANDIYPNGHHVYCVKADNEDIKVDFYQSGCFNGLIENIKSIGKATLKWKITS